MSTTNRLRIGTTSGTVADMPWPTNENIPITDNEVMTMIESQTGDRTLLYTKKQKSDFTLNFVLKDPTDYNTLIAFCGVPTAYYVVIQNSGATTKIVDGYYYLRVASQDIFGASDNPFRRSFSIQFIQE